LRLVKVDESVVCVFDTTFVENTSHMHVCVFYGIVAETCFLLIKKMLSIYLESKSWKKSEVFQKLGFQKQSEFLGW
jgi:hypothetical protein